MTDRVLSEQERIAQEAATRMQAAYSHAPTSHWLDYAAKTGLRFWKESYAHTHSSDGALDRLVKWGSASPHAVISDAVKVPTLLHEMLASALWVDQTCPVVTLTHKWCAAAICTNLPPDTALHAPWRAFVVEIPEDVIPTRDPISNTWMHVRYLLVQRTNHSRYSAPTWCISAILSNGVTVIGNRHMSDQTMLDPDWNVNFDPSDYNYTVIERPVDEHAARVISVLKRLVCNILVTMTAEAGGYKQVGKHVTIDRDKMRMSDEAPPHRRFLVSRPCKIDLRSEVREYLMGTKKSTPRAQVLVRGHHKRQRFGKKLSQSKVIWIEPYWQGDIDAVISSPRIRL